MRRFNPAVRRAVRATGKKGLWQPSKPPHFFVINRHYFPRFHMPTLCVILDPMWLNLKSVIKKFVLFAMLLPFTLVACSTNEPSKKYGGAYIETVLIEVKAPISEIEGLSITANNGHELFRRRAGSFTKDDKVWSGGLGAEVPEYLRVVWRKNSGWDDVPIGDPRRADQYYRLDIPASDTGRLNWSDGTVAGDYTIPVAKRIPPAVSESLRKDPNGTLRIKLKIFANTKIHPNGVAVGWEIQRHAKGKDGVSSYELVGGDFQ
jgi:hypothetical protein